ncbi:MAG: tetratricopeptide repeat protein [Pirellulaceae bacterium]|nr:tetratricopeptide repeat protein [Pirellulaceae bacterium]
MLMLAALGRWIAKELRPLPVEVIYADGLNRLHSGDLAGTRLSAEALSAAAVDGRFKDVLEAGIDLRLGRVHEAAARLQNALDFPPTAAMAHIMTGEAFYKNRQFSAAIQILKSAIELDDSSVDAHRWLAAAYYDLGATEPAVKELAKVAALAPEDPRPHRLRGLIYKDMESYDAAAVEYREALRRSSAFADRPQVLRELADCLLKTGQHQALDEILRQCPVDAHTLTCSAESKYARGEVGEALRLVDQALFLEESHLDALLLKATLQLDSSQADKSQLDAALGTLQRAVAAHPQENRVHYQLSQLWARMGQAEFAAKHAAESTRLRDLRVKFTDLHAQASGDWNDAEIRYQLGLTARELGLTELAITWFSAAIAIQPEYPEARAELQRVLAPDPLK